MSETTSNKTEEKAAKQTVQTTKETASTNKKVEKSVVIYIGPEIPEVVAANTIFNNGISEELENTIKEVPAINKLIISLDKLASARMQLKTKDSALAICYENVCAYAKKKGE